MGPRTGRRVTYVFLALLAAGGVGAPTACITPPPEWVNPPPSRVTIRDDDVDPPLNELIQNLPGMFTVPIQVDDPQENFHYSVFVDYDSVSNPNPIPNISNLEGFPPVTRIAFVPPPQLTPTACHRLEFIVAHNFATLKDGGILPHTPDPAVGGDHITWFYLPGGSPNGCPAFDAGLPSEASADVSSP
jgi:hypothetical protein